MVTRRPRDFRRLPERGGREPLAERGGDAAGDEEVLSRLLAHGGPGYQGAEDGPAVSGTDGVSAAGTVPGSAAGAGVDVSVGVGVTDEPVGDGEAEVAVGVGVGVVASIPPTFSAARA